LRLQPIKWLSFAYWELDNFFQLFSIGGSTQWKVMTALGVAQMCIIASLYGLVLLLLGHKPSGLTLSLRVIIVVLAVAVYVANYRALLYRNKWLRFRGEFELYSRFTRVAGRVGVLSAVLGAIVGSLVALAAVRGLPLDSDI
jgi:hypothetical protein